MATAGHPLAQMALDFLLTPGMIAYATLPFAKDAHYLTATSTDYEWAFSQGGLTVSRMCHALSDESVHAATVLGSWCSLPDIIPQEEIMIAF